MAGEAKSKIAEILKEHEVELLAEWTKGQMSGLGQSAVRIKEAELREQCRTFLQLLQQATRKAHFDDMDGAGWQEVRDLLAEITHTRGLQGFSPTETAIFVFSFKKPLFVLLRRELGRDAEAFADETWRATQLIDKLGLFTTEIYQKSREEVINRQQQEMLELSTPVVKLWEGVLALPLIGTLDSARTQVVMESLLQRIVETESE